VVAAARACPRFPPRNLNGKEGVDGSSPSEGFEFSLLGASLVGCGGDGALLKRPRDVHTVDVGLVCGLL
jgi:hypothetical protein